MTPPGHYNEKGASLDVEALQEGTMRLRYAVLAVGLVVVLAACAPGANDLAGNPNADGEVAGFWGGLWHGIIMPVTFVISLFSDTVGVYEPRNIGGWYNFGFLIGLVIVLGGGGKGSGCARR